MLRVGVTIQQIENKHLQNLLIFRVLIIWGCTKKIGEALPPNPPRGYGPADLVCCAFLDYDLCSVAC